MHSHPAFRWFNLDGLGRIPMNSTKIPDPCKLKVTWIAFWEALLVLPLILAAPACSTKITTPRQFHECITVCRETHRTEPAREACYK